MASWKPSGPQSAAARTRFLIPDMPAREDLVPYLRLIDETRWYSNFGPLVNKFEEALLNLLTRADRTPHYGPIYLTTLASGHHALEAALRLYGITRGKKVLLPAITFPACPLAVQHTGSEAVLSDIDPTTWTLTPQIARAVASRTQVDAVMPVALYGVPVPTSPWDEFRLETGIPIIIDAAAAVEAQQIPQFGLVANSLHATKPLGIGEGGILVGRDAKLVAKSRQYINFGTRERICYMDGTNAKLSEYHAAVGLAQVARWIDIKHRRSSLLQLYLRQLAPIMELLSVQPGIEAAIVSLFVLMLKRPIAHSVLRGLAHRGIATHRGYLPPLYRHPHFANLVVSNVEGEVLPPETHAEKKHAHMVHSEKTLACLVGMPFHSFMSEDDVVSIVQQVKRQLLIASR